MTNLFDRIFTPSIENDAYRNAADLRPHPCLSVLILITIYSIGINANAASCGDPAPSKSYTVEDPLIDTTVYLNRIISDLGVNNFMGYAVILRDDNGKRLAFYRRGWAISPCDSTRGYDATPFTLNTKINIGSTTKAVATTPSVLHLLDNRRHVSLNTFLRDVLPNRWAPELHARWKNVTLSQMLQHRGGFAGSGNNNPWSASNARARLSTGDLPSAPDVGFRQYSNSSMGMFHFTMMAMGSSSLRHHYELTYSNLPDENYDTQIAARNAEYYNNYTKKFVFGPANVDATCRMMDIVETGGPYSLIYSSINDTSGGVSSDNSLHCAAGGWIMSIKELISLIHHLKYSNNILSQSTYALMEDRTLNSGESIFQDDESLGWFGRARIRGGWAFRHNGLVGEATGVANSHVIIYPNGYYAAIVSNSRIPSGINPGQSLIDAFELSYTPTPGYEQGVDGGFHIGF